MSETPGAYDFIDSLLRGEVSKASGNDSSKLKAVDEVTVINRATDKEPVNSQQDQIVEKPAHLKAKSDMETLWEETEQEPGNHKLDDSKEMDFLNFGDTSDMKTSSTKPAEITMFHEESDDIVDAIEEIEVIDGMALLQEDVKDDMRELNEVFMETGVEEGQPLPPSQRGNYSVEAQNFPVESVQGTYYVVNNLRISHFELMVGGPVPSDNSGKDDLINRLRLFIHELHSHLEKSEDKRNVLKKEYSKKTIEVKESEELVLELTGQLTEQATAIQKQMKEVEDARSQYSLISHNSNALFNEVGQFPAQISQVAEGMTDEQLARKLYEDERSKVNKKPIGEDMFVRQQTLMDEILAKDSFPGFTYKLIIKRAPLGFTIKKTEGAKFCKVESITRNDLKKSGLVTGLQVLEVNHVKLKNKSLPEVLNILESQAMPVEIRLRRELTPWKQYTEFQTTSWGTKKAVTTWTFYCSRNKPRIIVLEHNQRKGKAKRKVVIDGEIRYERKSTKDTFKFTLENDTIYIRIRKSSNALYTYELRINESSFYEAMTSFVIARTEVSAANKYV
jgi:hypothetical protein